MSMLPDMEPIQLLSAASGEAGMTSAIALPRRVTRRGIFVLLTSSSNDRHFALNSEIPIFCIDFSFLPVIVFSIDQYSIPWSYEVVKGRYLPLAEDLRKVQQDTYF